MELRVAPGQMQLTQIPKGASSRASVLLIMTAAAFASSKRLFTTMRNYSTDCKTNPVQRVQSLCSVQPLRSVQTVGTSENDLNGLNVLNDLNELL
jgi:hypothetical protein